MEIIGRTVELKDGTTRDEFVLRCAEHNWYFKGQPPLTHGCQECWHVYFYSQVAMAGGDIKDNVEQLEQAIHHAAEAAKSGKWDFIPQHPEIEISHEN
jgi:hypothetical protein